MRAVGAVIRSSRVTDVRTGQQKRVPWTPSRVSVLAFSHDACRACEEFLAALDRRAHDFACWGVGVWSIHPDTAVAAGLLERLPTVGLAADPDRELADALAVERARAAVVVLDAHGQVFYGREIDDHDFPAIDELVLEARFPALQCPECDTPDVPGVAQLPG